VNARAAKEAQDVATGKTKRTLNYGDIKRQIVDKVHSGSESYFIVIDLKKNNVLPSVVNQLKEENFEVIESQIGFLVNEIKISWSHA
jgi:hypothetical protein